MSDQAPLLPDPVGKSAGDQPAEGPAPAPHGGGPQPLQPQPSPPELFRSRETHRGPVDVVTLALATGLGIGFCPVGPGTCGSVWGLALAWGLSAAGVQGAVWGLVVAAICLAGVPICGRGARLLGQEDPGAVVYDELAALPLALLLTDVTTPALIAAFVGFRIFDIAKPWPVSWAERLPGGWGIMADDIVAALLAAPCVWAVATWQPVGW